MPELRRQASRVKSAGRGRDTELVHMTPREIMAMEAWLGRKMPRNPKTGLREASLWDSVSNFASSVGNFAQGGFNRFLNPLSNQNVFAGTAGMLFPTQNPTVQRAAGAAGGLFLGGAGAPEAGAATGGTGAAEGGVAAAGADAGIPADFAGDAAAGAAMTSNAAASGIELGDAAAGTGLWSGNTYSGGDVVPFGGPGDLSSMAFGPEVSSFMGDLPIDSQAGPGTSIWDQTSGETGGGQGSDVWKRIKGFAPSWKGAATGLNLAAGGYGLWNAAQMRKMAQQAQDPHLREYQDRLNALTKDPSSVTSMPGYQFGLDEGRRAIQRSGAATGSGGNEAIALARYTPAYAQQFYENQVRDLSNMSRGDSTALQGNALAMQLANQALWQLGYGAMRMGG